MTQKSSCTVVMYHYVRPIQESFYPEIKGREFEDFKSQLNYIKSNYKIICLSEYVAYLRGEIKINQENICVLTFDDGLREHYDYVLPELLREKIIGTFFIPTLPLEESIVLDVHKTHFLLASVATEELIRELMGTLEKEFPERNKIFTQNPNAVIQNRFDDLKTARFKYLLRNMLRTERVAVLKTLFNKYIGVEADFAKKLYMGKRELRSLADNGMEIGSHSHSHEFLPTLSTPEQEYEIIHSKNVIEEILEREVTLFSYPNGKLEEKNILQVKDAGYKGAVTVEPRTSSVGDDFFQIPRLDTNDISL